MPLTVWSGPWTASVSRPARRSRRSASASGRPRPASARATRSPPRLRLGYRHVDTARIYGNEADVGAAIRDSGIAARAGLRHDEAVERRPGLRLRAARVRREPRAARPRVRRPLPHPLAGRRASGSTRGARSRSCTPTSEPRAIGVSNFLVAAPRGAVRHARRSLPRGRTRSSSRRSCSAATRARCAREHGIVVEAYSPLTRGEAARPSGRRADRRRARPHARAGAAALGHPARPRRAAEVGARASASPRTARCSTSRSTRDQMRGSTGSTRACATGWDPATMA